MTADEIYDAIVKEVTMHGSADFNHLADLCPGEFTEGKHYVIVPPEDSNVVLWHGLTDNANAALRRFIEGPGHFKISNITLDVVSYLTGGRMPDLPLAKTMGEKYKTLHWMPAFLHLDGRCKCDD